MQNNLMTEILIELLELHGLRSSRTTASQRPSRRGIAASRNDGVEKIERVSPMPRFFRRAA